MYAVSFNINDDLSVSYGKYRTRKAGYTSNTIQLHEDKRYVEVSSIQAAYTMGGASLRVATSSADNVAWSAGKDQDTTTVSLSLAF